MADTPSYFPSLSGSSGCKCVEKVVDGGTSLPSSFYLDGNKRKRSFIDGFLDMQDGSSLSLGLGCSMSSGVTVFSCKENEEHTPCDLDLTMNLMSEKSLKGPEVDLELSLAAGSVESDVTATSRVSFPFKYNLNPPVSSSIMTSAGVQLADEGSTSSRWKLPLLSPYQTTEPMTLVQNVPGYSGSDLVIHGGSACYDSGLVPSQQRRNGNVKECQFIGCTRGARGASGFCIAHGGGRRCQREGCRKGAEGKTVFCKAHGGGFLAAPKALKAEQTIVLVMVVVGGAAMTGVPMPPGESQGYVYDMVVEKDAKWKVALKVQRVYPAFVSLMVVAGGASTPPVLKVLKGARCFVKLMVVVNAAHF